jgi:hypothetical protein
MNISKQILCNKPSLQTKNTNYLNRNFSFWNRQIKKLFIAIERPFYTVHTVCQAVYVTAQLRLEETG